MSGLLGRLLRSQSGNVLWLTAAAMPVVVGAAGLADDTIQWSLWKRQLQRQADSAALAGAYAVSQGKTVDSTVTHDLAKNSELTLTAAPVIENAPTSGAYAGDTSAVRVVLQYTKHLPFSGLFLSTPPTITAEATAATVQNGNYCIIALENTTNWGIKMWGNATVDMGCGLATNSKSQSNGVMAGGSSWIRATPVASVGGLTWSSNYQSPTTLQPYSVPQADPYSDLPVPSVPSGCGGKLSVNTTQTQTVTNPTGVACYKGMDLKGTVTFAPGIYYIDGSTFDVGAQAHVSGTGVTFILTSSTAATNPNSIATVNMNGGATVDLSATTSGTYAGILFYQDPRAPNSNQANQINGNASSKFQGAIYMPSQEVNFTGTSGMVTNCLQIVSRRVQFTGNMTISNNCPAGSGAGSFQGTAVKLVA